MASRTTFEEAPTPLDCDVTFKVWYRRRSALYVARVVQDHVVFSNSTRSFAQAVLLQLCFQREYPDNYLANGDGLAARNDYLHGGGWTVRQLAVVTV